jgi:hypothetical protein
MKKYTTPTVEVKTFVAVNKIADVNEWLSTDTVGKTVAATVDASAITSYALNS